MLESKATLQAIIESSKESIWSLDTNLKVIFCNQKVADQFNRAFGKKLGEGMSMLEMIPEKFKELWEVRYKKALNGESIVFTEEIEIENENFLFESSIQPVFVNNKIIGIAVFSKDVTETTLHIKTIEKQNKTLKEIAWMQSHKVRAPLARLMGLVMLLEEDDQFDIPVLEVRKEILNSSLELDSIIREISSKTHQLEKLD
ncbi:PAS domain-containing sensor histidine kinase [Belliella baltica]|uniref:PAS domain-containing sensor histidine kinase n=1 Tax=Belliella baltica TaxID=232259 RepID=UPI00247945C2|nr:PAS domain-containing sensor histidine kinase [Belliella baltica]